MRIDDALNFQVFREHTATIPLLYKATKKGLLVTDQSTSDSQYTVAAKGDQVGWVYWAEDTRAIGAWGQIIPCVAVDALGTIRAVLGQALGADTFLNTKEVVLSPASNDHTKVMSVTGALPASGELGFVVQGTEENSFEQLWFPAASSVLKCDNVSPTTYSSFVYGVVLPGGGVDLANIGKFDDVWFVESNLICNDVDAYFRLDAVNKGPLKFLGTAYPSLAPPPSTPYVVETKLAFDGSEWRWYTEVGGDALKCDNLSPRTFSSSVFGVVLPGGTADPANIGKLDDAFFVESNELCVDTDATFRQSALKKGPLKFQTTSYPTLEPPEETPYTVETKCSFDGANWRWFTQIGGGGESTIYAKILWNFDVLGDLSEGETMLYDGDTDIYTATGTLIWIDYNKSRQVRFETAGNLAIFEIKLVTADFDRRGTVRDLYRARFCALDSGYTVTHLDTEFKLGDMGLLGFVLSDDLALPPWETPEFARVKTTIGPDEKNNKMLARLPGDWDIEGPEDFRFLEVSDFSRGMPDYFRPVRPVLADNDDPIYASAELLGGEVSIATYRRFV